MDDIIIGIEIGGTYVRTGVADSNDYSKIVYSKKKFVNRCDAKTEVEVNICNLIDELIISNSGKKVIGIGISSAAIVNRDKGTVTVWPNHQQWNDYPILNHLKNRYPIPIVIEDDANCGAIGEYSFLGIPDNKSLVYISIGTGVGCGIILNGSLYIGENGYAGELGHIYVSSQNTMCACGQKGCLQSVVSGPAITKTFNMLSNSNYSKLESITELIKEENQVALQCYNEVVSYISRTIYNMVMVLDISCVVIGGGVSDFANDFITCINKEVNNELHRYGRKVKVLKAQLGEMAGIYGAIELISNLINKKTNVNERKLDYGN